MKPSSRALFCLSLPLVLAACGGRESPLPVGSFSAVAAPPPSAGDAPALTAVAQPLSDYRIGPLDRLRVTVLLEPDLSVEEIPVDVAGGISLPLAGRIQVSGHTTEEVTADITHRLDRYLRAPHVAVNVIGFKSRTVTVQGAVQESGVFEQPTPITLLQAIALAKGPTDLSKQDEVLVFRNVGGKRYVARFDIASIQRGEAIDPMIESGDTVVVGYSYSRQLFRDSIAVLPAAVGIFLALIN